MTTTELIELLRSVERGFSGRSREIDLSVDGKFMPSPLIRVNSTGDGIAGAELCLDVESDREPVKPTEAGMDSVYVMHHECSECGGDDIIYEFNFCPGCGVKLDWGEDE